MSVFFRTRLLLGVTRESTSVSISLQFLLDMLQLGPVLLDDFSLDHDLLV